VIQPLLNSSAVKDIKVILNDSFKLLDNEMSDAAGNRQLVRYFNGVTLHEAAGSHADIDAEARNIVGRETNDRQKAYLIYLWICSNLTYDNDKAEKITRHTADDISSGAIVAYTTRTGVCFDFSCLYVAMCRSVGVKVRFLTGLGYTGDTWGDHAWNQVYVAADDAWVNVDTTFGSSGINYFDRPYFYLDHKDGVVHGEW
jgi:transglutaminase-like putative cysteine protease